MEAIYIYNVSSAQEMRKCEVKTLPLRSFVAEIIITVGGSEKR